MSRHVANASWESKLRLELADAQQLIKQLTEALEGVAIMLNAELQQYESEPWAQRVRAALAAVKQTEQK